MTNAGETYVIVRHSDLVQWQYSLNDDDDDDDDDDDILM